MRLPVALELLELLATVNIPHPDRLVTRPTDELRWIRRVEPDGRDPTAAIVSNVSFTGNFSTPLPRCCHFLKCQFYWYYSTPLPP